MLKSSRVFCPICFSENIFPLKDIKIGEVKFPNFGCGHCENTFLFPVYIDYLYNLTDSNVFILVEIKGYGGKKYFQGYKKFSDFKTMLHFAKSVYKKKQKKQKGV